VERVGVWGQGGEEGRTKIPQYKAAYNKPSQNQPKGEKILLSKKKTKGMAQREQ
jgi:hypothetical protein